MCVCVYYTFPPFQIFWGSFKGSFSFIHNDFFPIFNIMFYIYVYILHIFPFPNFLGVIFLVCFHFRNAYLFPLIMQLSVRAYTIVIRCAIVMILITVSWSTKSVTIVSYVWYWNILSDLCKVFFLVNLGVCSRV